MKRFMHEKRKHNHKIITHFMLCEDKNTFVLYLILHSFPFILIMHRI